MYILDCGVNKSTILNSETDECRTITHDEILTLPTALPQGSTVVCEYAHLGCPRGQFSRSQPFTEEQLISLYDSFDNNGITLKLFPQQSTPRACNYSGLEKSDENDPRSIYKLISDFPEISMMNPPRSFGASQIRQEAYDWKNVTNAILNVARRYKYLDDQDQNTGFLIRNINRIAGSLSPISQDVFGLTDDSRYKRGNSRTGVEAGQFNLAKIKVPQIYSVLAILQDYEGTLRTRGKTGELPGWKFAKRYVICMAPFHFRGGVARSNLYYHGLRHWVSKKVNEELGTNKIIKKRRGGYRDDDGNLVQRFTCEEDDVYLKYRQQYCKAIKELYVAIKTILEEEDR